MKKYIVRSLKYFFALCVLCIALMGLMLMTGLAAVFPSKNLRIRQEYLSLLLRE